MSNLPSHHTITTNYTISLGLDQRNKLTSLLCLALLLSAPPLLLRPEGGNRPPSVLMPGGSRGQPARYDGGRWGEG